MLLISFFIKMLNEKLHHLSMNSLQFEANDPFTPPPKIQPLSLHNAHHCTILTTDPAWKGGKRNPQGRTSTTNLSPASPTF